MATTFEDYNAPATYSFTFPSYQSSDVKVRVDGVLKTAGTHYNIDSYSTTGGGTVVFIDNSGSGGTNHTPSSPSKVRVYRDTNVETAKAEYTPGSSVKAADLNNNHKQLLYRAQEEQVPNLIQSYDIDSDAINGTKIADNSIDSEHYVDGSIDHVHLANDVIDADNIQDDVINSEHYVAGSIDEEHIANSQVTSNKIADNAVGSTEIANGAVLRAKIAADAVDGTKLADDAVGSEHIQANSVGTSEIANGGIQGVNIANDAIDSQHYAAGSVDHEHLANDIIDGDNIQDDVVNSEHIAAGALDNEHYAAGSITADKLNGATVITASEQGSATTNDTSFLTSAAADARFFNISSGDTIKDGQSFPDNDTTIATTAAINDRIIDLIDDVGGFTIIASEQAFPNVNPQGVTGQAAVLSIKSASTDLVPSGTTVTINNGNVANNANITITGVPSTIPSGFGFLVESTTTLHTYTFHRLVPDATEVTTVAGKATEIGRLGTAAAVEDMSILGTTDAVADMAILGTADVVSDMNTLATADIVSDMNTLAVTSVVNNMDTVATNVANVNNVGTNIAKVNTVSAAIGGTQTFVVTVSGGVFYIDGQSKPVLTLARGFTYTFNQADSSNSGHPLAFRDSSDNAYTTGVTVNGTAGSSGATVVFAVPSNAPSSLKYYCTVHGNGMGNTITVTDDNIGIVAGSITNVNEVGDDITNVNSVATSITNVNTVATNINSVNSFFNTYRIGASNPTTSLDTGDLFFNTTSNSLKVYTGSAWVDGVTATGNFAVITGNTFTGSNNHNDNVRSIYGTGSDFQVYHDGNNANLNNSTGYLSVQANAAAWLKTTGVNIVDNDATSNYHFRTFKDGSVQLFYDNSLKLNTKSDGVDITGELQCDTLDVDGGVDIDGGAINFNAGSNRLDFADNVYARFGNSQDLSIYHDGSNSRIKDSGAGNLNIQSNTTAIQNAAGTENCAVFNENGAVELFHSGTKKFETTSSGISITDTGPNLAFIDTNQNSDFRIKVQSGLFMVEDTTNSNEVRLAIDSSGKLAVGTTTPFTYAIATFNSSNGIALQGGNQSRLLLRHTGGGTDLKMMDIQSSNGVMRFRTLDDNTTATNRMVINADGHVDVIGNLDVGAGVDVTGAIIASGDITTNGGDLTVSGSTAIIHLTDTNNDDDFSIMNENGTFRIRDATNSLNRLNIDSNGTVDVTGNLNALGGLDVTGNITVTGTVDGVDIAALNTTVSNLTTDLVSDTSPQLGGQLQSNGNTIKMADSDEIIFGSDSDATIQHDNQHFYITNLKNNTYVQAPNMVALSSTDTNGSNQEHGVKYIRNGAVELYHDNTLKFGTDSAGVYARGDLMLNYADNYKIKLGAGNDLLLYHDSSTSRIDSDSKPLTMRTLNGYDLTLQTNSENAVICNANASVDLYYNNVKKLETTSGGIYVHGECNIGGGTFFTNDNGKVRLGSSQDLELYHNGTHSYVVGRNTGNLYVGTNHNANLILQVNGSGRWSVSTAGHLLPEANNTYDIGTSSYRVRNLYTNDLHLSNEGSSNDVDGTWGDWTMQEGESDLFLKNNRSGKKYKFNLTEVS